MANIGCFFQEANFTFINRWILFGSQFFVCIVCTVSKCKMPHFFMFFFLNYCILSLCSLFPMPFFFSKFCRKKKSHHRVSVLDTLVAEVCGETILNSLLHLLRDILNSLACYTHTHTYTHASVCPVSPSNPGALQWKEPAHLSLQCTWQATLLRTRVLSENGTRERERDRERRVRGRERERDGRTGSGRFW